MNQSHQSLPNGPPALNEILFSVIIPVYKAATTLQTCVESILAQAPTGLEVILVDDGSPDGSGALCDRLAGQDSRVRVIHQANAGASAARNAGLDAARGRWVQFVDADDWVLPGLYQTALPILDGGPDVLFFGVENVGYLPDPPLPDAEYPSLGALAGEFERFLVTTGQFASPCNKLYRADVIGPVRFDPALKVNEDLLFNLLVLQRCGPVRFVSANYYACDHRVSGSLSRSLRIDLLDAEEFVRPYLVQFLRHYEFSPRQVQTLVEARTGSVAIAQMSVLMSRRGCLSLRAFHRTIARMLRDPVRRSALLRWLAQDSNRLMALPYRISFSLRCALPAALWCWLRNSTDHSL